MSDVISPRNSYMEKVREYPLSRTLSEVAELFEGDIVLTLKSQETLIQDRLHSQRDGYALGQKLQYRDSHGEELWVYLGLIYSLNGDGNFYPANFFFGSDLEGDKLEIFLGAIQGDLRYGNPNNVLDTHISLGGTTYGCPLLTCVESHKARKKGLYYDAAVLPIGSKLSDLKEVLDS